MCAEKFRGLDLPVDPFAAEPDDGIFFPTPALTRRLSLLVHLIAHSSMPVLVAGEAGAGKTTLLNRLVSEGEQGWQVAVVEAKLEMGFGALLGLTLDAVGLPRADTEAAGRHVLREHLEELSRQGRRLLLLVDEAHTLPPESLAELLRIVDGGAGGVCRLLLFAEPQLLPRLGAFGPEVCAHSTVHVIELLPFTGEQVADYIHLRLTQAGLVGDSPFSAAHCRSVYERSRGLPAGVNAAAAELLLGELGESSGKGRRRGARWGLKTWAAVGVLLMVTAAGGIMLTGTPEPGVVARQTLTLPPKAAQPAMDPGMTESAAGPMGRGSGETAEPVDAAPGSEPSGRPAPRDEVLLAAPGSLHTAPPFITPARGEAGKTMPAREQSSEATTARTAAPPGDRARLSAGPASSGAPAGDDDASGEVKAASVTRGPVSRTDASTPPTAGEARPGPARASAPEKEAPMRTAARPREPSRANGKSASPLTALATTVDSAWLADRNPRHYTIQLAGSHSAQAAAEFVGQHRLEGKALWFRAVHRGRPWYVVVYGVYPDRMAAVSAIGELPEGLRRLRPWARSLASVRKSISSPHSVN